MPKYTVVTTVIERRKIEAPTPAEAIEINNGLDDNNYVAEVPERWVEDEDGTIVFNDGDEDDEDG